MIQLSASGKCHNLICSTAAYAALLPLNPDGRQQTDCGHSVAGRKWHHPTPAKTIGRLNYLRPSNVGILVAVLRFDRTHTGAQACALLG